MKDTSITAYRISEPKRASVKEHVYQYVCNHPGCTHLDIKFWYGETGRKRLSELVKDGDIFEGANKQKFNGLQYTTYWPKCGLF
jgi:hypothetical protein